MRVLAIAVLTLLPVTTAAYADNDSVTYEQAKRIQEALAAAGCIGGEMEKATGAAFAFEVEDAVCDDNNEYDLKLDKDFKIMFERERT